MWNQLHMSLARRSLALSFIIQMVIVILIISYAFYAITAAQSKQFEKQLEDKAALFATILGANIDKILGDNFVAFAYLQDEVVRVAKKENRISALEIYSPRRIILASMNQQSQWQTANPTFHIKIDEVTQSKEARSIIQIDQGQELVIHFLPILTSTQKRGVRNYDDYNTV